MKRLIGLTFILIFPLLSLSQNDTAKSISSFQDTASVIPDAKAPMVPPYNLEFFNGPKAASTDAVFGELPGNIIPEGPPVFNPKISLGAGMLSFYGDLYGKHYQAPWTSRIGYDLNVSHRLNRYLMINFNLLFGKLGANENLPNRHENFQSEIRAGGINLLYDFGNFIPDNYRLRPWISLGASSFEFLSKTDLFDRNGEKYHYWSDGSIKNMEEGSAGSQYAKELVRDYTYETDIRERNADGFGKYQERAWAFPVGFGALMHISDRFDFKMGVQYYFTNTDYIDGITNKSVGDRSGTKSKDKFVYTSFALQYDLVLNKPAKDTLPDGYYDKIDWLAIDNADYDKDGVRDWDDHCQGTPEGVKVDKFGCPLDGDEDGVPDYLDDENPSPKGYDVNLHGVALTDEFWQNWYDHYFDSLGVDRQTEQIGNAYEMHMPKFKKKKTDQKVYTVEIARYEAGVPSDEMAYLLSIGDMKSTVLEDGSTVVYTAGSYEEVKMAAKRRDEFIAEGNKKAKVGYFKNDKYATMSEEELQKAIKEAELNTSVVANNINAGNTSGVNANNGQGNNNGNSSNTGNNNANNTSGNNNNVNTTGNNNANNSSGNNNVNNAGNNNANNTSGNNNNNNGNNTANNNVNNPTVNTGGNEHAAGNVNSTVFEKGSVVYRVQLGAYKNRISTNVFKNSNIVELKTEDNYYRYVTNGFKTIQEAADHRADLVMLGYTDAFVTAYKDGKRIAMNKAGATMSTNQKEDLSENKTFSTIDKSLISFKIQIGALKRPAATADMDERVKVLEGVEKQTTSTGMTRYSTGLFKEYQQAEEARKQLEDKGFPEAFIIAVFKEEIISLQEAMELLK